MSDAFKDAGPGERSVYDRTGLPEVAAIARMAAMSDEELIARLRLGPEYVYRFVDTDHVAADRIAALTAELAEAREQNRWAYIQAAMDDRQTEAEAEAAALRAKVARLEGESGRWEKAFAAQSYKLQKVLDIPGVRAALTDGGTEYERKVSQMKEDFPNGI